MHRNLLFLYENIDKMTILKLLYYFIVKIFHKFFMNLFLLNLKIEHEKRKKTEILIGN